MTVAAAKPGVLQEIRDAARTVTAGARLVTIDDDALSRLAEAFDREPPAPVYPGAYFRGPVDETVSFVLTLETLNFGSGWFPHLHKRPGCSGHFTVAASLTDLALGGDLWDADQLTRVSTEDCVVVFGQDPSNADARELMALFARALNDLGDLLLDRYDGSGAALVESCEHSAEQLLLVLDGMPFFRDVGHLDGLDVPFYKRAQICSATLTLALDGDGLGRFDDLDRLTMFADNLVPHVLWCEGVLHFESSLVERIATESVLPTGGREEIELRAGAIEAVERIVRVLHERGRAITAMEIDESLWHRGQRPEYKAKPRPRIRTTAF